MTSKLTLSLFVPRETYSDFGRHFLFHRLLTVSKYVTGYILQAIDPSLMFRSLSPVFGRDCAQAKHFSGNTRLVNTSLHIAFAVGGSTFTF